MGRLRVDPALGWLAPAWVQVAQMCARACRCVCVCTQNSKQQQCRRVGTIVRTVRPSATVYTLR